MFGSRRFSRLGRRFVFSNDVGIRVFDRVYLGDEIGVGVDDEGDWDWGFDGDGVVG